MVEEASECTADVRKEDFFPNASKALSVESSLYIKQYPQLYYGHALNGKQTLTHVDVLAGSSNGDNT